MKQPAPFQKLSIPLTITRIEFHSNNFGIFYSPIDRPASVINAGVKLSLNTCRSVLSADKRVFNIGLTPTHDPGKVIDRTVRNAMISIAQQKRAELPSYDGSASLPWFDHDMFNVKCELE